MQNFARQVFASTMEDSTLPPPPAGQVYTVAVLLATISLILLLLILPPLFWHFRNRNIGATSLVAWISTTLLLTIINAMLWSTDDTAQWFNGKGLCDLEVKIMIASQVALPSSLAAVLRGLAAVLDTDRATLTKTESQRRRDRIIDLSWCIGAPLLQMVFHELVHFRRYYVYGISGCVPVLSNSWLSVLLICVPPLIWTVVDIGYASKSFPLQREGPRANE